MIEMIEKKIQIVQFKDSTFDFFCHFFAKKENRKIILLIYDHDCYVTNIGYEEARGFCDEKEFIYFLGYICKEKDVTEQQDFKTAERILEYNCIHYVLIKNLKATEESRFFFSDLVMMDDLYKKDLYDLRDLLEREGVNTYFVRVPQTCELKQTTEWTLDSFAVSMNWSKPRENQMKTYLEKFTELEYDDAKRKIMSRERIKEQIGDEPRTIFLIGPCIIGGWENYPEDRFSIMLRDRIVALNLKYKVISLVVNQMPCSNTKRILEYDIKQNDIVFIIEGILDREKSDLELDYIYANYSGDKWLYSDVPMHTTRIGNELIINELIDKFILPIASLAEDAYNYKLLHKGERQLTYEEEILLKRYLGDIKKYRNFSWGGVVGACIMTCNPFTKGHFHLIEYAAKQVALLYIFIVEEEDFFFPFEDRLKMVKEGVKDLKNVVVLPGGNFMISKATFKNYFEKELCQDITIDASKDIMIFRDYIAPALHISKRFVGEEPFDNITNQYNHLLKEKLPEAVEVVEIPRKKINRNIISASKVRAYLAENKWNEIEKMVPRTTYDYLMQNIEKIREKKNSDGTLKATAAFIKDHDKIVVCGLGDDCNRLMESLKKELNLDDINKLEFYDRKASQGCYRYMGKNVIKFNQLVESYQGYYLLVATSIFKKELFCSLIKNGIKPKYIKIASENI